MNLRMLFLLFLFSVTTAQAQTTLVGITAGPTYCSADGNTRVSNGRDGYTAGITFQHFFLRRFSLGVDLMYSQRGYTREIPFVSMGGWVRSSTSGVSNFNYLSLPLKIGVKFGKKAYFFANIGLLPAVLLRAESPVLEFDARGNFLESRIENVTSQTSRFDMGGLWEMGVGAKLSKEIRLSAAFSYQSSFGNTRRTTTTTQYQ